MSKKLWILLLLITTFLVDIDIAYAIQTSASPSINDNSGTHDQNAGTGKEMAYDSGTSRYLCEYKQKVNYDVKIEINAYDISGTSLIPYSFTPSNTIKAGTWVGINANEYKSSSWQVSSFEYYELKKKVVCTYHYQAEYVPITETKHANVPASVCYSYFNGACGTERFGGIDLCFCTYSKPTLVPTKDERDEVCGEPKTFNYNQSGSDSAEGWSCPATCNGGSLKSGGKSIETEKVPPSNMEEAKKCKVKAGEAAARVSAGMVNTPSNILEYIDTNNYDADDFEKNLSSVEGVKVDGGSTSSSSDDSASGGAWAKFAYSPQKTCIDVKTAKVTYDNKCIESDSNKLIPNGTVYDKYSKEDVTYWHYFIPLNAKTDSIFYVRLKENKASLYDARMCESFMQNSPNDYPNIIKPKTGGVFIGDYSKGKNSSDYKKLKSGCYVAMTVYFKVDQDFYNEKSVNSAYSLNGYKFYFRQVDINKPFNTIPNASSSWYEWYTKNSKNGTANFNKSFNTITYTADVLKPEKIRNYNSDSDNFYTSWQKMREDGTSEFITKNDFVTRKNSGSTYKLGCGPGNADWSGCK